MHSPRTAPLPVRRRVATRRFGRRARRSPCRARYRDSVTGAAARSGLRIDHAPTAAAATRIAASTTSVHGSSDSDLRGVTVHEAARIMAAAAPDEILVSELTRSLASTSGLSYEDRGTHELKGLPGMWRLSALVTES
jgi:hypothetical protein